MTGPVPAVLLVPAGEDRMPWLSVATAYAASHGLRVDAVTSDTGTAAQLHAGGWTVLTSVWRIYTDPFRLVDLDRVVPEGESSGQRRARRTPRARPARPTGTEVNR